MSDLVSKVSDAVASPKPVFTRRMKGNFVDGIVIVGLVALGIAFFIVANRPPFMMVVTTRGDSSTVQFVQPSGLNNHRQMTEEFSVETTASETIEFDLRDAEKKLVGAKIEFSDTTILPGRIRICYGGRTFDVMSSRIIVDGVDESWRPDTGK